MSLTRLWNKSMTRDDQIDTKQLNPTNSMTYAQPNNTNCCLCPSLSGLNVLAKALFFVLFSMIT